MASGSAENCLPVFCQPHIVSILDYYLSRTKSSQWPVVLPKIAYQFSASHILYPFLTIIYQEPDPVSGQWFCQKLLTSFLPATYCIQSSRWPVVLPKIAYQFSASHILYPFLTIINQEPNLIGGQWFCRKIAYQFCASHILYPLSRTRSSRWPVVLPKNCLPVFCQPHIVSILDYYLSRDGQWFCRKLLTSLVPAPYCIHF